MISRIVIICINVLSSLTYRSYFDSCVYKTSYCDMFRQSAAVARQREVKQISKDTLDSPTVIEGAWQPRLEQPQ
jgi:hypothetical protein